MVAIDSAVPDLIPASWARVQLPIPGGETIERFIEDVVQFVSPRWQGMWTWASGDPVGSGVVLAAPGPEGLAVLLAHVVVLTELKRRGRLSPELQPVGASVAPDSCDARLLRTISRSSRFGRNN